MSSHLRAVIETIKDYKLEQSRKEMILLLIKDLEKTYSHSSKIKTLKNKICEILRGQTEFDSNKISLHKFNEELSKEIINIPNISFRKLINYMPDKLFMALEKILN